MSKKVLFVLTSHDELGNTGLKTGFWTEELAGPYYALSDKGVEITLASPNYIKNQFHQLKKLKKAVNFSSVHN